MGVFVCCQAAVLVHRGGVAGLVRGAVSAGWLRPPGGSHSEYRTSGHEQQ